MRCVNCQNEVPSYASVCPFCGELVRGKPKAAGKDLERKIIQAAKGIAGEGQVEEGRVFKVLEEAVSEKAAVPKPSPAPAPKPKAAVPKAVVPTPPLAPKPKKGLGSRRRFAPLLVFLLFIVLAGGIGFFWYQGQLRLPLIGKREVKQVVEEPVLANVYELLPDDTAAWLEYDWQADQELKSLTGLELLPFEQFLPEWLDLAVLEDVKPELVNWSVWAGEGSVLVLNQAGKLGLLLAIEDRNKWLGSRSRLIALLAKHEWQAQPNQAGGVFSKDGQVLAIADSARLMSISNDPAFAATLAGGFAQYAGQPNRAISQLRQELNKKLASEDLLRFYAQPSFMEQAANQTWQDAVAGVAEFLAQANQTWRGLVAAWSSDASAWQLHTIVLPQDGTEPVKLNPQYGPGLAAALPAGVPVLLSTSGLDMFLNKAVLPLVAGYTGQAELSWEQLLQQWRDDYDLNLTKDFFSWLTQETIFSLLPQASVPLLGHSPVLLARVDQTKARAGLKALEGSVGELFADILPGHYVVEEVEQPDGKKTFEWMPSKQASYFEELEYEGNTIRYYEVSNKLAGQSGLGELAGGLLAGQEFGIYYSLENGRFMLTADLASLKQIIDVEQKKLASLAAQELYQKAQAALPARIYGYFYLDAGRVVDLFGGIFAGFIDNLLSAGFTAEIDSQTTVQKISGALLIYESGERSYFDTHFRWFK